MAGQHVIKNFDELATTSLRADALTIAKTGLASIDTASALRKSVRLDGEKLCVGTQDCELASGRLFFVGVGKCAAVGAMTLEGILGDRLTSGIALDVSVSEACRIGCKKIECFNGTHPTPSEANMVATKKILFLLQDLTERDTVIVLVSGGGSTLLCQPPEGGTCADEALLFSEMTKRGANIVELNTVRKHSSLARGGALAKAAYPARVIGLIFSDVPGNDISYIASGPTVKDDTTVADAQRVLGRYQVDAPIQLIETPKEDKYFERVTNVMVVNNNVALVAMSKQAEALGYAATIITNVLQGEARDVARDIARTLHAAPSKTAVLYGGETTVTLAQKGGDGGRNQELAIAALLHVADNELILPFASDGRDNSDVAGGIADKDTKAAALRAGVSIDDALRTHCSLTFFTKVGCCAMRTGETGSNVSDLIVALKE